MKHLLASLLGCLILALPAPAQFDSSIDAQVLRRPVNIGPISAMPIPPYMVDFDVWPPVDTTLLGSMPVVRPSRFVGTVSVDTGYYVQNRYPDWVSEYKVYTASYVRFGGYGAQLCTQICGQVNWGNGSIYALAPFAGVYHQAPTPTPAGCSGILPNSDWHFARALISFPVTVNLDPGANPITVWPIGGVSSWNDSPISAQSHVFGYSPEVQSYELHGWILSRPAVSP